MTPSILQRMRNTDVHIFRLGESETVQHSGALVAAVYSVRYGGRLPHTKRIWSTSQLWEIIFDKITAFPGHHGADLCTDH